MKEAELTQAAAGAVARLGRDDVVTVAGVFEPRGHSGSAFAGGLAGESLGGGLGQVGGDIGLVAGEHGAQSAHDAATGLPEFMLVGVSESTIYGFEVVRGHTGEPGRLVFEVPREGLIAKVHGRVNVRVLELIEGESGSKVELEGSRIGPWHVSAVLDELR